METVGISVTGLVQEPQGLESFCIWIFDAFFKNVGYFSF